MGGFSFVQKQISEIKKGGWSIVIKKMKQAGSLIASFLLNVLAIPFVIIIRIIRPFYLVRFVGLISTRIGHFAGNTELYLCELDAGINKPKVPFKDFCFFISGKIANRQLATMWKRILYIWPTWLIEPIKKVNKFIPGWEVHNVGENAADNHNLLDRSVPHLRFTEEEEMRGENELRRMGISASDQFVCLLVRDSAYLSSSEWNYHSYRDCDIQNYLSAAEELAARGYFVIRMGQVVQRPFRSSNPKIIDYASNGMRSDFMDIYLGAKCAFCISTGAGWDAVPSFLFRKHTAFTNLVPLGYAPTFSDKFLLTTKRLLDIKKEKELTLSETFASGAGFYLHTSTYKEHQIELIENTPEELKEVAIEMAETFSETLVTTSTDRILQNRFWQLFPSKATNSGGKPLHGEIRTRFGKSYLQQNQSWLQ